MPEDGGASMPEGTYGAASECDNGLRSGDDKGVVVAMERRARQTAPETIAVCRLCAGVARVNLGQTAEGLADLREAEELQGDLPESIRPQMLSLLFSGQVVGYAAEGDADGVRAALDKLAEVDPERARQYAKKCDIVKPEGSDLPCEAPEPKEPQPDQDGSPTGPEPSPTGTEPDIVTSPPDEGPTGEPPTEPTDTPEPVPDTPPEDGPPGDQRPGPGQD